MQISFIGWAILSTLTLGIGNLWLTPYMTTAEAAFYRELTGTWNGKTVLEENDIVDTDDEYYYGNGRLF